jgi:hypothetical protein
VSFRVTSVLAVVSVVVVSAGVLAGGGAAQADEVWYQGYGRASSTEACPAQPGETPWQDSWGPDASWHPSWEMWANGGRGGWTCWRSITWARDPVAPTASPTPTPTCVIGATGPGGGTIFYNDTAGGKCYEAAPASWNGGTDPALVWCNPQDTTIAGTFGTEIGTGKTNTDNMVAGGACGSGAANSVRDYGTATAPAGSWSLPSQDELNQLYLQRSGVGGFAEAFYWSSSQVDAVDAWNQDFVNGIQYKVPKPFTYRVRPVRAF